MNSAKKLPFWHKGRIEKDDDHTCPLDFLQGAGLIDAQEAYKQLKAGRQKGLVSSKGWDVEILDSSNTTRTYDIFIADSDSRTISATIVWNRHYSDKYPFEPMPQKDADLRIELWAAEPESPDVLKLLDYSDSSTDNVEHIYFNTDNNHFFYRLVVAYGGTQTQAVSQAYALTWRIFDGKSGDDIGWYDLNADGIVDDSDTATLINNVMKSLTSPAYIFYGDINSSGAIDANDFELLGKNYNRKAPWRIEDN